MFGTDGIRGRAYEEITPLLLRRVALAVRETFGCQKVVVGYDPRESSPDLTDALLSGFEGVEVDLLGVAPTPAVAYFGEQDGVPALMVSASHNPYYDNGVKIFAPGGRKLDTDEQAAIVELLEDDAALLPSSGSPRARVHDASDRMEEYLDHAASAVLSADGSLQGLRLVVDAANGACSTTAPELLRRLGAQVREVCCRPNGRNINEGCGAASPQRIAAETKPTEIGLAFDGDGDRVAAYDEGLVDGDHIIAMCGIDRKERGRLAGDTVVVTVMSNLGFHRAMRRRDIDVVTTPVGDRHIVDALESGGWELGGEQSGHVIFRDLATTGDGLLTAVALCDLLKRRSERLSVLASETMTRFPQVLCDARVGADVDPADAAAGVSSSVAAVADLLGEDGRVLVRASGTEAVVRVMVEASTEAEARKLAADLADEITGRFCGHTGHTGRTR